MCKHCEQGEVIGNFETSKYGFDELTINGDIKINYCPICGRKLS
ncbi:hypothetical protein [Clostridium sp. VAP52]|nr:hypothetical protein [Clostridium sp. VAP52]